MKGREDISMTINYKEKEMHTRRRFLIKTACCAGIFVSPISSLLIGYKATATEIPSKNNILENNKQTITSEIESA